MDAKFSGEWSASEIETVKSLITRHNAKKDDDTNNKHTNVVNELQRMFPWKGMNQVMELYIDLVTNKMHNSTGEGSNQRAVASSDTMNPNFGASLHGPGMDMLRGYSIRARETSRRVIETPRRHSDPRIQRAGGSWTEKEHRLFLHGLNVYGRGNWKNMSRNFVTTRTPVQISSHAQKYFRRLENPDKQRYSINDVSLDNNEAWVQNKAPNWEGFTFVDGKQSYANHYGTGVSELTTMNNNPPPVFSPSLDHTNQASSSSQAPILAGGGNQMRSANSSSLPPAMDGAGSSHMDEWTGDLLGDFHPDKWLNMDNI